MKIALIRCPTSFCSNPPLALASLQALLKKKGHSVFIHDIALNSHYKHPKWDKISLSINSLFYMFRFKKDFSFLIKKIRTKQLNQYINTIYKQKPDTVCLTLYRSNIIESLCVAEQIKKKLPNTKIIVGGPLCYFSFLKNYLKNNPFVDFISDSGAEFALTNILSNIKNNQQSTNKEHLLNLNDELVPDFSGFNIQKYIFSPSLPYSTSRGCYKRCVFCIDPLFAGSIYRIKSSKKILKDLIFLKKKYKVSFFIFADSVLLGNPTTIKNFCEMIIKKKVKLSWGGQIRVEKLNHSLINLMAKAGCRSFSFGIESGSQKIVNYMQKDYDVKKIEKLLPIIHKSKILISINFILGHPKENLNDFLKTLKFIFRNRRYMSHAAYNSLSIFEGTKLYNDSNKYGIKNKDSFFWSSKTNPFIFRVLKIVICKIVDKIARNHFFIKHSFKK